MRPCASSLSSSSRSSARIRVEGYALLVLSAGDACLPKDIGQPVLIDLVDSDEHPRDVADYFVRRVDLDLLADDALEQVLTKRAHIGAGHVPHGAIPADDVDEGLERRFWDFAV
jgi:hypothetical protein